MGSLYTSVFRLTNYVHSYMESEGGARSISRSILYIQGKKRNSQSYNYLRNPNRCSVFEDRC